MPIYLRVCRIVILMDPPPLLFHISESIDSAYAVYLLYLVYICAIYLPAPTYCGYLRLGHKPKAPEIDASRLVK